MNELLKPNVELAIDRIDSNTSRRKTSCDVVAVRSGRRWVSIDSRLPNRLVSEALREKRLKEFQAYPRVKPEIAFGNSRFDFLLESSTHSCLLEVKSCTLVTDGVALFPDAPTARGRKHLQDLMEAKRRGFRACVMFVIQRDDAISFTANLNTDPAFGASLKAAERSGVEVYAKRCKLMGFNLTLDTSVPVKL
jgi:sugar fermentation stimulation protein A